MSSPIHLFPLLRHDARHPRSGSGRGRRRPHVAVAVMVGVVVVVGRMGGRGLGRVVGRMGRVHRVRGRRWRVWRRGCLVGGVAVVTGAAAHGGGGGGGGSGSRVDLVGEAGWKGGRRLQRFESES